MSDAGSPAHPAAQAIHDPAPSPAEPTPHSYIASLIVTVVLALFATTFLVQAFKIPSASMSPSLLVGDHLLVNKFICGRSPNTWYERLLPSRSVRRGDIIVFKYPYEDHPYYVKRVIGVPGDRVRIADQRVYVNGAQLHEPYVIHNPVTADPYMFDFPPRDTLLISGEITPEWAQALQRDTHNGVLLVPSNDFFVLGDNRDNSSDSRYWGFVPRSAIVGEPMFVYWSVRSAPAAAGPSSFAAAVARLGKAVLDIPSRTRWNRIFHEVR